MKPYQHPSSALWTLAQSAAILVAVGATVEAADYLGPCALVASKDGKTLYVAAADAKRIMLVDIEHGSASSPFHLPAEPTGLTLSPDGTRLYVTCGGAEGMVLAIDAASGQIVATIPAGHTAMGPAATPDGKRLFVCNRFDNDVSVIDLEAGAEVARLPATREPVASAVTPDGESLLVVNHLPVDQGDAYDVAAAVTVFDTQTHRTTAIRLPNGSSGVRDVCVAPGGSYAFVTHVLCHYELPATQVGYGWMNTNALSIIDVAEMRLLNTVLLDERELGAANPWGVALTADGNSICVAHAGSHELSVIDTPALLEKLLAIPTRAEPGRAEALSLYDDRNELLDYFRRRRAVLKGGEAGYSPISRDLHAAGAAAGVPDELSFLVGLRRRVALRGRGPRALAVVERKAYVAHYFTDTLDVVDLEAESREPVTTIALGPKPRLTVERRGEMLFHDGDLCFQRWQSCASCHPDGRADALNWDLLNDGVGNPKNTKTMLLAHRTPPAMSWGVRVSAELAVRSGLEHILFAEQPEADAAAIDEYLKSLKPVPSPHLEDGQLSPAARRGKELFESDGVGCHRCHPAPLYTDLSSHDVRTQGPYDHRATFDTPTLIEVWRTAPYLHDGRYTTVKELIAEGKHGSTRGNVDELDQSQIDDLVEFVLSL